MPKADNFKPLSDLGKTVFSGGVNVFLKVSASVDALSHPGLKVAGVACLNICVLAYGIVLFWFAGMFIVLLYRGGAPFVPWFIYVSLLLSFSLLVTMCGFGLLLVWFRPEFGATAAADPPDGAQDGAQDNPEFVKFLRGAKTRLESLSERARELRQHLAAQRLSAASDVVTALVRSIGDLKGSLTKMHSKVSQDD